MTKAASAANTRARRESLIALGVDRSTCAITVPKPTYPLVPRTRSSHRNCRESDCELRVQSGTRIIELLVSFDSAVRFGACGNSGELRNRDTSCLDRRESTGLDRHCNGAGGEMRILPASVAAVPQLSGGMRTDDFLEYRRVMHRRRDQHEGVPDGVLERQQLPQVEYDARAVEQAAGGEQREGRYLHHRNERCDGGESRPSQGQVE